MRFFDWIGNIFGSGSSSIKISDLNIESLTAEVLYKRLAIETCIDLIANSAARAEFQTFEKGKKTRKSMYYQLNVAPNKNQNQVEFLKEIIRKLIYQNECLVVQFEDQFFVADSFNREKRVVRDTYYTDVTVDDFTFNRSFQEADVFYFKYSNQDMRKLVDGMYGSYGKLLKAAMNVYKRSNAKRYILKGNFLRSQTDDKQKKIDDMMVAQLKPWLEADNAGAVFQLQEKYELSEPSDKSRTTSSGSTTEDIRKMIDSIWSLTARVFHVPSGLLNGETVELSGQQDFMLTFMTFPVLEIIATEMNRKLYTEEEYLARTYLKIDTNKILTTKLTEMAESLDKFMSIGAFSLDDVLEYMGFEPFNEEWSQRRYITKNYADVTKMNDLKGGGTDDS